VRHVTKLGNEKMAKKSTILSWRAEQRVHACVAVKDSMTLSSSDGSYTHQAGSFTLLTIDLLSNLVTTPIRTNDRDPESEELMRSLKKGHHIGCRGIEGGFFSCVQKTRASHRIPSSAARYRTYSGREERRLGREQGSAHQARSSNRMALRVCNTNTLHNRWVILATPVIPPSKPSYQC
jgi:hypothetical protein